MDADHLDIYGTAAAMEDAFIGFSEKIRKGGILIRQFGLKRGRELKGEQQVTYSLQNENAVAYASNIRMMQGGYEYDVVIGEERIEKIRLNMGGMHNVENTVAAITVASSLGIEPDRIRAAVESFRGVKRRFEYLIKNERLVFIDDYAHHPEELKALITGAKTLFPQRKCTVIFQPHLYSRTRDLADGFASSLDLADEVVLLPIYPARELPLEGVNSNMILDQMKGDYKSVMDKQELLNWIASDFAQTVNRDFGEILITAGAGDIDMLLENIKESLKNV